MTKYSDEWTSLGDHEKLIIQKFQEIMPVPIGRIAQELGILVKISTLDVGISGMIKPDIEHQKFKIIINKHEPPHRRRFTLAHEIAHFLLHKNFIKDGISDNILYRSKLSDAKEAEANRLASDILMPPNLVKEWKSAYAQLKPADAVSKMSAHFGVSEDAMRIRLGMKK